jgi:hypothetical protein
MQLLADEMLDIAFNKFIPQYSKNYKDQQEYLLRKTIFQQNLALVLSHDSEAEGFEIELNKYSDWTDDEFDSLFKLGSSLSAEQKII